MKKITAALRTRREGLNLTQEDAARAIGVVLRTYIRWESGQGAPSVEQVRPVAGFMDLPVDATLALITEEAHVEAT